MISQSPLYTIVVAGVPLEDVCRDPGMHDNNVGVGADVFNDAFRVSAVGENAEAGPDVPVQVPRFSVQMSQRLVPMEETDAFPTKNRF